MLCPIIILSEQILLDKKVLFILRIPPPYGGGEIVSKELYNKLSQKYDFLLINQRGHSKSRQANPNLVSIVRGLMFIYLSVAKIVKVKPQILFIGLSKGLGSFLRNSVIIIFARFLKIRVYGELHGMSFLFLDSSLYRKYFFFIISKVDKIRVLGESIKKYLENLTIDKKIYIIPNGITKPGHLNRRTNINYNCVNFLYLGGISKKKGFGKVLNIFCLLNDEGYTNWSLNVIGEWINAPEREEFLKLIDKNSLKKKILLHGRKLGIEKWELMNRNDFLLHLTDFDGQPLTILETMSLGIPAVTTKVGAIPETIKNDLNGFLIEDEFECANIMRRILNRQVDYHSLSQNCLKIYKERYTAECMANSIVNMIEH